MTDDGQLDAAILAVLAADAPDGAMVPWTRIRRRVPGTFWRQTEALCRLWTCGRVYVVKVRGRNDVGLADALDARIAASRTTAQPRVLQTL